MYVGRSSDLARARAFRTFELGDQRILLVRDDQGVLQGFHNTCRHRGAALCRESDGLLRTGTIVCPYHAWVYNLQGDLLRTSSKAHASGFDVADFPLYKVSVKEWNGFVFIFPAKLLEMVVFETCNMPYPDLEMYTSAPIKVVGRRGRSAVDVECKFRRLEHDWNDSPMGP